MTVATAPPTTAPKPKRADALRNRDRVLEAARKCMALRGLDVQMDEIAKKAGVGVGTVYRHFPNKDEIIEALAGDRFVRLAELADEAVAMEDPWEAFVAFMQAGAEIQNEDRALSEVLTSRPETMRRAAESVDMLGRVSRIISRAQDAGAVRADAEPEDIPMVMCALAGTCRNPMSEPDRYIALIIDGMRAPGTTQLKARAR